MVGVGTSDTTEIPVYSLYGDDAEDLSPKPEWLRDLDAIVIDLQDVGSRYYTYVWTAALTMKVAAAVGTDVVLLDRPNPLGGARVEGAPQREAHLSFVGLYPVAVRHGLTIAELMQWVCDREHIDRDALHVVSMDGWTRSMEWKDTGLPWVMPSPNMPTLDTALVYPGGCLVEGTKLSEGRGTTRPFELWGAPGLDIGPAVGARSPWRHAAARRVHTDISEARRPNAAPGCRCTSPIPGSSGLTRRISVCSLRCSPRCRLKSAGGPRCTSSCRTARDRPSHGRSRVSHRG